MFEKRLTRDADQMACILYKEYLERRKGGVSKSQSREFWDSKDMAQDLFPNENAETVSQLLRS